jgi:hypothetical protein
MPNRPLPKKLIERIKTIDSKKGNKIGNRKTAQKEPVPIQSNKKSLFSRLKIIDWRKHLVKEGTQRTGSGSGYNVREFDVSRNYPKIGRVAVKKVDFANTSDMVLRRLKKFYDYVNKNPPRRFVLKKPHIYKLDNEFLLMAKTNLPTISEFFRADSGLSRNPSLNNLKPATRNAKKSYEEFKKNYGFSDVEFVSAVQELNQIIKSERGKKERFKNNYGNFFISGYKNGKFIFIQKADIK